MSKVDKVIRLAMGWTGEQWNELKDIFEEEKDEEEREWMEDE